jgi:uncharacterized membrane-anchored protein
VSRRARLAFLVLVAVQACVPLAMAGLKEAHLAFDRSVRLKTQPVDPLDVFRGRYVQLNYEISSLPAQGVGPGQTVYVPLRDVGDRWVGETVLTFRPSEEPFIRGRVAEASGGQARIDYGIESYFVDERKAREYEGAAQGGNVYVDVVLDDDGDAQIERLILP